MRWWWQQTLQCMPRATLGAQGALVLWPCCWDPMHHSSLTEVGVAFMTGGVILIFDRGRGGVHDWRGDTHL